MFTLDRAAIEWEVLDADEDGVQEFAFDLIDPDDRDNIIGVLLSAPTKNDPWSYQVSYDAWEDSEISSDAYADGIADSREKAEAAIFAIIEHLISLHSEDKDIDIEEVQCIGHDETGILQFTVEIPGYGYFKKVRSHPDGVEDHWIADGQDVTGTEQEVRDFLTAKLERERDGFSPQTTH